MSSGREQRTLVAGSSSSGGHHSYAQTEQASFADYISNLLSSQQDLVERYFPLTADTLFGAVSDGVLLCRLVNAIAPGTIPRQKFTDRGELNALQITENLSVAIQYAREKLGCRLLNIGANDLADGKGHLILAFLWQLIKIDLANSVAGVSGSGAASSEAIAKLTSSSSSSSVAVAAGTESSDEDERNPESMLFDWVNEQLEAAGHSGRIRNFSGDIRNCEKYVVLLNRLAPHACPLSIADEPDPTQRAELFLQAADKVDCRKFVSVQDICRGNSRMNFAFVASLFSHFHGVSADAAAGAGSTNLAANSDDTLASNESGSDDDDDDGDDNGGDGDELAARLAAVEIERDQLRTQLDRAMQLVKQQSGRLDVAAEDLERAKEAHRDVEAERDALRESSERELATERAKMAELADASDSEANKQWQEMCERLEKKLNAAQERIEAEQERVNEAEERANEAETRAEAAEEVLLELKEQLDVKKDDNEKEKEKEKSSNEEVEELQRQLRNLERVADKAEKNKEKLSFLKDEVADLSEENNVLVERLQFLQGRFDDDEALARAIFQECAADALQNPTRAGMLTKQGGSVKTWKRRYFVLKENFLFYYKSQKDASKPLGVIHLDEYEVVLAKPDEIKNQKGVDKETRGRNFFKIITPTRTYFVCAERQVDMDLWLDAIKSAPRWYRSSSAAYRRTIARAASSVAEGYDDY